MSVTCDAAAEAVTRDLGFSCHDVNPVVSLNNPFALAHWTQPLLELLIVGGAIFALVHAIRRHRDGDGTNLALWFGSLVYLAIIEPPLYFPEWFGLDTVYGFIFAHNEFTVQFMYDRLPLYIVAFYPAFTTLAYEVVRAFGVFARRGAAVGALCVAFVAQVFYEVFDQLGPQLGWWAWNPDNLEVNHPMFGSVPMTSMLLFASVSLGFLTYVVVRLARLPVVARALIAGVLTPLAMVVAGLPSGAFRGNVTAQAWVLGIELALVWIVGGGLLLRDARQPGGRLVPFVAIFPAAFLTAHALFWLAAGARESSWWYVVACFVAASGVLGMLWRRPVVHRVFSYGTLRQPAVQLTLFGREVPTVPDALPGYRIEVLTITDPDVIATSGSDRHPILRPGEGADSVDGACITLTERELAAADAYEVDDYERHEVTLASGNVAWVYLGS